jgi:hypothetical protein
MRLLLLLLLLCDYIKNKKVPIYYSYIFLYIRGIIIKPLEFFLLIFSFMTLIIFYFKI